MVRLLGVLTAAEQHLVKSLPAEKGRDLLKQVRTHLLETARPLLEAMVQDVTGRSVVSMHHDISTRNRRRGCSLHAGRIARVPRDQEEIDLLNRGPFPLTITESERPRETRVRGFQSAESLNNWWRKSCT